MTARRQHEPQVSVVVPTKDRDALLRQTLSTISWQQDVVFEALVVDDGSADRGLVERIVADLGDARFRIVRHDRSRGVSAARNRGTMEAKAPWVAFCDDDDLWAPDKLAEQLDSCAARSGRGLGLRRIREHRPRQPGRGRRASADPGRGHRSGWRSRTSSPAGRRV